MKKLHLILAASLLPLTVSAGNNRVFSGAYVGGGLGANFLSSTQTLVFDPSKVANTAKYNMGQSKNNSSLLGQLYLGYGYLFAARPVYLALEGIAEFSHPSITRSSLALNSQVKQHNAYGGRAKLGYAHQSGLLYVLAGVEGTSINRNLVFNRGGKYNSDTMLLENISAKNHVTITQVGAGINIALLPNWVTQLEYAHNFYNDKNYSINHTLITFNNPKGAYSSNLEGDEVSLGIKYLWKN